MPGTPPTTPNYGIPRYSNADPASFPSQWNAGVDQVDAAVKAVIDALLPRGFVSAAARSAAPTGWLLCDGSSVSRFGGAAALFAAIGTTYGAGKHRCPEYSVPGGSRCRAHGGKATPSGRITQGSRWRKLRRELIDAAPRPLTCALCRKTIADDRDAEVDNIQPVSQGGHDYDPYDPAGLRLTHKRYNRRRRTPGPHPNADSMKPPWMLDR